MILQEKNLLKKFKNIGLIKLKITHLKILVSILIFNFFNLILVVAIAANKSDLIEKEQVNEAEARKYAKEMGALFKVTSACTAAGIEELFRSIGCKILNPNYSDEDEGKPVTPTQQPQTKKDKKDDSKIKLDDKKAIKKKEKKGFC